MKVVKKTIRIFNIILMSFLFLIATTLAITPSVDTTDDKNNYLNFTNIVFYGFYILFGYSLLQFIRNKNSSWNNYVLAGIWILVGYISIAGVVFLPVIDKMLGDVTFSGTPNIYTPMVEVLVKFINDVDGLGRLPDAYFGYLVNLVIGYDLLIVFAVIIFIPFFNFILLQIRDANSSKLGKSKFFLTNKWIFISTGLIGILIIFNAFFGGFTSELLEAYRIKGDKAAKETNLTFTDKIDNFNYAKGEIVPFLKSLNFDLVTIGILAVIFFTLTASILNSKLNSLNSNLLTDERN